MVHFYLSILGQVRLIWSYLKISWKTNPFYLHHTCTCRYTCKHMLPKGQKQVHLSRLLFFRSFTVSSHMLMPSESNRTPGSSTTIQTTERVSRWSKRIRERETERWQKERGGVGASEYERLFFFFTGAHTSKDFINSSFRLSIFKTV